LRFWLLAGLAAILAVGGQTASPQSSTANTASASEIIQYLNQTITWYRESSIQQKIVTEPTDLAILYDNRQTEDQIVRLAFDLARSEAELITTQGKANASLNAAPSQYQSLHQLQAKLDKQVQDTQAELDSDRQKAANAAGARRQDLQSQVSELQGELELAQARRDAVRSMAEFEGGTNGTGLGATGLNAQIEALASSVPGLSSTSSTTQSSTAGPLQNPSANLALNKPEVSGLWDLTAEVWSLSTKVRTVQSLMQNAKALAKKSDELRGPLVKELTALSNQGDQLAAEADTARQSQLGQERQQLDALAKQFKQISAVVIPLTKESVLLGAYQQNLANWQDSIRSEYRSELRNLGLRLVFLFVILAIVIAAAELWRRAVYRYVHETRRRYQFLLLRKFVLWAFISVVVAFAFASRLGSIVTFAGLITAGVAVALQNVILSVVGYFFLIGKYGIRVGDRVQIGGVTGEVIDVGLVRIHLMELGGNGAEGPTGRVVAFSNAIVFQATAGLFKQMAGIHFAFHEITLMLPENADHASVKERLLGAVATVLKDYKEEIERQYREIERTGVSTPDNGVRATVQLRFAPAGVEAIVRYPVNLQHAAEIDERVSQELLKALHNESKDEPARSGNLGTTLKTNSPLLSICRSTGTGGRQSFVAAWSRGEIASLPPQIPG